MAKRDSGNDLQAIEDVLRSRSDWMTAQQISDALQLASPRRTLQHRLKHLLDQNRLVAEGKGRWTRYRVPLVATAVGMGTAPSGGRAYGNTILSLSKFGDEIREYVRRPVAARRPVGYDRAFLDTYRPNRTFYLTPAERMHLREVGTPKIPEQPAGTYAKHLLSRLLIDLSWNSSRLEGNTYSLLDTKRLIDLGEEAEGKERSEAQMILNHKDAIEFLVGSAEDIGFDRYTIFNLHALLANNLLADPAAPGRLRRIGVGIERSVFHPLEVPQLIEECFDQILTTASAIIDPFEQSFFVMAQLPYLKPFDDANKRVLRLSANIPLIKHNLAPLSFVDVPRGTYTDAMLGIYEMSRTELLRDVFTWAYERSAARYAAVRQSLGEPDPFRLRHRQPLRAAVSAVIRGRMDQRRATAYIAEWVRQHIDPAERERFQEIVESELLSLHEGNFARYQVKPSEFAAWREAWGE